MGEEGIDKAKSGALASLKEFENVWLAQDNFSEVGDSNSQTDTHRDVRHAHAHETRHAHAPRMMDTLLVVGSRWGDSVSRRSDGV